MLELHHWVNNRLSHNFYLILIKFGKYLTRDASNLFLPTDAWSFFGVEATHYSFTLPQRFWQVGWRSPRVRKSLLLPIANDQIIHLIPFNQVEQLMPLLG